MGDEPATRGRGTYPGSFERPSRTYASRQIASAGSRPDPVGGIRAGAGKRLAPTRGGIGDGALFIARFHHPHCPHTREAPRTGRCGAPLVRLWSGSVEPSG
ncbi:hypothetical protein GCM10010214_34860 [Streptomyces abikoensis]|nr:hypothetical protein GCM10010214_34860 [Streptomyces abikoensis]